MTTDNVKGLDPYTRTALKQGISRRSLLSGTAAGAVGVGLLGLGDVAAAKPAAPAAGPEGLSAGARTEARRSPSCRSRSRSRTRTSRQTLTFDVVVVGAGASGVPAALSAAENGAKVAVIQKAPVRPVAGQHRLRHRPGQERQGRHRGARSRSSSADNNHRCNPALIRQWAYNSGEAVRWVIDRAKQGRLAGHRPGQRPAGRDPQGQRLQAELRHVVLRAEAVHHRRRHAPPGRSRPRRPASSSSTTCPPSNWCRTRPATSWA